MNTSRLSFKAVFLLILLSAACASVPPNADREEGQAAITLKTSDADIKEARSAFDSKDYAKAIRLLTPLAEQGNPRGQYALGIMYAEGRGVSKDYSEAMKWFRKSAEQGNPRGQYALGTMYAEGRGVSKDYSEAMKWFRKSAEQGNPRGQYALGTMYAEGRGVSKDYSEAMKWFRKSAEQGYPKGQAVLGWMYHSGSGVDEDYSEAMKWFRKAAEHGYPPAQTALGTMYGQGQRVSRDYSEAMKWYRKAAEQGYPPAQTALGTMYYGQGQRVSRDYSEAMKWYRKAAEQEYSDAQWRVGAMYANGQSVSKDYAEAEKWFRKAASQGNPHGALWLGRLYIEGWGIGQNVAEAAMWYKLAVDKFRKAGFPVERFEDAQGTSASALLLKAVAYPPEALAMSYLWVKKMLHFLPAVDAGATINLPDKTITKSNVEEYRGRYEKRLSLYGEAIKQRGYKTISGAYKGETTESCAKIQSAWVGVIHERSQSGIEIEQHGIEAQVVIRVTHEGKELSLKNEAAIAESAISVLDAMNSDYFFRGEIKDQAIVIKPNLSVLDKWPKWAGPPSRSDLENCTITLKPLSADSGSEQRGQIYFPSVEYDGHA
ncbi:tetratricopeptide repeat protein (plasmid) [Methylomarinum sp. Ch1-1]|uniref:Tetratricopeptide repeat protein n=1 Tax=Methylomarinum roseum TaxID=3067653 RepID=A0AAU7NP70_9GAMM|nr:tetratricopeptide repeat protein [Methylomarinum sp. Ch1-1]MDP4523133.1 tetratricopeptide repeat protein [Methylomarinum sp. Ch1-1]